MKIIIVQIPEFFLHIPVDVPWCHKMLPQCSRKQKRLAQLTGLDFMQSTYGLNSRASISHTDPRWGVKKSFVSKWGYSDRQSE